MQMVAQNLKAKSYKVAFWRSIGNSTAFQKKSEKK